MLRLKIKSLQFDYDIISSRDEVLSIFEKVVGTSQKGLFIALNPEKIVNTSTRPLWKKIWAESLGNYVDGVGVVHAARILQHQSVERVFFLEMVLEKLNQHGRKLFLFGAGEGVALRAKAKILKKFPQIQIVDAISGYNFDSKNIIERINQTQPDVILVALGSPTQEEWIDENLPHAQRGIFMGVGGALDAWAGDVKRAPVFFQKIGFEWLYRLVSQPSRWRRQLKLVVFMMAVFKQKVCKS